MTRLLTFIRHFGFFLLLSVACLSFPQKSKAAASGHTISPEIRQLLSALDSLLVNTPDFIREKEARLSRLRADYNKAADIEHRYWAAASLYDEYCAYDSDSAMAYVDRAQRYASILGRQDLVNEMELNRSYIYSATGLLNEANESLRRIDPDSLPPTLALKYCDRMLFLSTHRDQYMGVERDMEMYSKMVDSLLQATARHISPDNPNYCWLTGWSNLNTRENARKAISVVSRIVDSTDYETRGNAMDAWMLSKLYERVGDEENRLKYLVLSAMADVRASNKEIASLEEISAILLKLGDLEHANSYINYCIAYANDYKSRVRIGQLARIQEQTLSAIHERLEHQAAMNRLYLAVLAIFLAVLAGAVFWITRQNRALRNSRATLNDANLELCERVNELQSIREELDVANSKLAEMYESVRADARELSESNETKEEYIANVFSILSGYITRQEDFRSKLLRMLKERKFDDALQTVRSPELSADDIKEFCANFDNVFLRIYPDFVEDFNTLLRPEERIAPRTPGHLTSDLRVYALVRLGVTDSVGIAKFLHCSVQTVYNIRQRTRNKAAVPREEFAARVRALGRPSF